MTKDVPFPSRRFCPCPLSRVFPYKYSKTVEATLFPHVMPLSSWGSTISRTPPRSYVFATRSSPLKPAISFRSATAASRASAAPVRELIQSSPNLLAARFGHLSRCLTPRFWLAGSLNG